MKQDTLEGKAKTKNGVKRLCFSIICILLEVHKFIYKDFEWDLGFGIVRIK